MHETLHHPKTKLGEGTMIKYPAPKELVAAVIEHDILIFPKPGEKSRNHSDSIHCVGQTRPSLSDPKLLHYFAEWIVNTAVNSCQSKIIAGIISTGGSLAAAASTLARERNIDLPMFNVRLLPEEHKADEHKLISGMLPHEMNPPQKPHVILIDDSIWHGDSKRNVIKTLESYNVTVTDLIVLLDRQLSPREKGVPIYTEYGITMHVLLNMDDLIHPLISSGKLSNEQLRHVISDYQKKERWDMPLFAQK